MSKLKRTDFDRTFRFRGSRGRGLVNCVACNSILGEADSDKEDCGNKGRVRRVKLTKYFSRGYMWGYGASKSLCDAFISRPLPDGIEKPVLHEGQAILLGSQFADVYHADPDCPYVIEELRGIHTGEGSDRLMGRPEIRITDMSEMVPGETLRDICEMPCCESKLPFQIWKSDYRSRWGIKPDGTEPEKWVRNGIVKHEKKVKMSLEEAVAVFDLKRFNSPEFGSIHGKISAVSNYLGENCNRLGSRPLSEAANPVWLDSYFDILEDSLVGPDTGADLWVYSKRLFDSKKGLEKPIGDLEKIPEGLILCMDTNGVFKSAQFHCERCYWGSFGIYGIVRETEDEVLLSKGVSHFIEIGAVSYQGYEHMWGEFGRGFNGLASFHEK